jgi:sarcosine oxidase/L-pipecolate oxidase
LCLLLAIAGELCSLCIRCNWTNQFDPRHSFKLLPNIGKHVVELLEGALAEDLAQAWRWRPGSGDALKSRRGARAKDLADMPGWNHDEPAAKL